MFVVLLGLPAQAQERGVIESPSAVVSGIGFISGWKCNANDIELWLTGSEREGVLALNPAQNMPRADTAGVCLGEANNGWIIQVNWNELIGYDTIVARDNGEPFDSRRFTIGHTGLPFIQDRAGTEVEVVDFPSPGLATILSWSTATQHFEVVGTQRTPSCSGDACPPGSGEGGEDDEADSTEPIVVNGYTIYPEPNLVACDGVWNTVSVSTVQDGVSVRISGWFCDTSEAEEEEERLARSCRGWEWAAEWCTVSKTCTKEVQGEWATFPSFTYGDNDYSCYRVKTACLGRPGGSYLWAGIEENGDQFYLNLGCFSHAAWTNTYFDLPTCDRDKREQLCHDTSGTVVWDSDNIEEHHSLENAVSCTWYCD